MRIHYVPIVLDHKVSEPRDQSLHDEIKYGVFYKKTQKRIRCLYTLILSHILDTYTQRKHEHDTFSY